MIVYAAPLKWRSVQHLLPHSQTNAPAAMVYTPITPTARGIPHFEKSSYFPMITNSYRFHWPQSATKAVSTRLCANRPNLLPIHPHSHALRIRAISTLPKQDELTLDCSYTTAGLQEETCLSKSGYVPTDISAPTNIQVIRKNSALRGPSTSVSAERLRNTFMEMLICSVLVSDLGAKLATECFVSDHIWWCWFVSFLWRWS